jgi:hypothetical protein
MARTTTVAHVLPGLFAIFVASQQWGCGTSDGGVDSPADVSVADVDLPGSDAPDIGTSDGGGDAKADGLIDVGSDAKVDAPHDVVGDAPSTDAPPADGGLLVEFVASDVPLFDRAAAHGSATFGVADSLARDGNLAALLVNGGLSTIGPSGATEIGTKARLSYGTTRFRVRLATCASTEELVNGLFDYENDGKDHDGDGLVDNPEIDIEILCGQPTFLNLTSWSQYTDDTHMRKISRAVDLQTGRVFIGKADAYGYDEADPANGKVDPALAHPGFYDPNAFYEMGWQWSPGTIRWFIVLGGKELTLWTLNDTLRVPHTPMTMRFNLWHPSDHWNAPGTASPAAKDATLSIDWLRFDPG